VNVGLVAVSGIRVCDAELMRLGMTLPGFVERSRVIASLPSLGLLTLAAMTPAPHRVTYIETPSPGELTELPAGLDLVAISSFTAQMPEAYALARRFRDSGARVVLGGLHVTALPDEAQEHADAVVVGEGEAVWTRLLDDADRGRLGRRYDARDEPYDLARAPVPSFEILDIPRYNRLTVQTSRGCPWRCTFCASSVLLRERYAQKPVARVVSELDRILSIWKRPFIEFADDNAIVRPAFWRALLPELRRRRVRWFAETDLSVSEDGELLDEMRRSGCAEVLIGLESPTAAGLDGVEMRRNWKLHRLPDYAEAVRRIQARGIRVNACFVLGLDGQGPEAFDDVFSFAERAAPYDVQITLATPFPGTPLHRRLRAQGRLTADRAWERYTLFDLTFRPDPMSEEELVQGFRHLAGRLYDGGFTGWRRQAFRRMRGSVS
jgi:radical SAM superfamily enzyme YgiQ (UPF0313 family)